MLCFLTGVSLQHVTAWETSRGLQKSTKPLDAVTPSKRPVLTAARRQVARAAQRRRDPSRERASERDEQPGTELRHEHRVRAQFAVSDEQLHDQPPRIPSEHPAEYGHASAEPPRCAA